MQAIPMVLAAGGKVLGGIAANKAGRQNQAALYGQAREEELAGSAQELRIRENARKAIGQQLAAQFGNGMLGGTGSALDGLLESQVNAALDALTVRRDAAARARSMRAEGDMRRSQGRFALIEGLLGAGSAAMGMKSDWAQATSGMTSGRAGIAPGENDGLREWQARQRASLPGNYDPKVQF